MDEERAEFVREILGDITVSAVHDKSATCSAFVSYLGATLEAHDLWVKLPPVEEKKEEVEPEETKAAPEEEKVTKEEEDKPQEVPRASTPEELKEEDAGPE